MSVIDWINEKYDIDESHSPQVEWDFEYNDETVVAIIGESGTGKTTLLRKWFPDRKIVFTMIDNSPIFEILYNSVGDEEEVSKLLFDVGLSSVPTWKNSYRQLSNGEKLRFEIAYKLTLEQDVIFVDEYTSMLDRQTAQNLSMNLNKLLEKYNKKIVLSTCHFDILDWIKVDRVVDTTLKKQQSHVSQKLITHTQWKLEMFNEICGEYLGNITI